MTMWLFILLIVATTMAIFGCLGYMWGGKKTFILLLILLGTLLNRNVSQWLTTPVAIIRSCTVDL